MGYAQKCGGIKHVILDPNIVHLDNWISNNITDINKQLKKNCIDSLPL